MIVAIFGQTKALHAHQRGVIRQTIEAFPAATQYRIPAEPGVASLAWGIANELLPDETYLFHPRTRQFVSNRFWKESGLNRNTVDAEAILVEFEWPPSQPEPGRRRDELLIGGFGINYPGHFNDFFAAPADLVFIFGPGLPDLKRIEKAATAFGVPFKRYPLERG